MAVLRLFFRAAAGCDYRALNHYILQMNARKSIDDILFAVSRCLKDMLDYELFGFALKGESGMDVWVEPGIYREFMVKTVKNDFPGQEIDCKVHFFEKSSEGRQKSDSSARKDVIPYTVMENFGTARLYIIPRRTVLKRHEKVIRIIVRSLGIALENALMIRSLENAAAIDPLTNCFNRRALNKYLEADVACAYRYERDLSLIMIDLDNFKVINDTYGHAAGDMVLKDVSRLIASSVRKADFLARYGGEEFVLVLPETALPFAVQIAEKVRKAIEQHPVNTGSHAIGLTASLGVAELRRDSCGASLLREADEMLYRAKSLGKNRVAHRLSAQPVEAFAAAEPAYQYL
jgi:diguanylate cyclase (GGDEF)-like protein